VVSKLVRSMLKWNPRGVVEGFIDDYCTNAKKTKLGGVGICPAALGDARLQTFILVGEKEDRFRLCGELEDDKALKVCFIDELRSILEEVAKKPIRLSEIGKDIEEAFKKPVLEAVEELLEEGAKSLLELKIKELETIL